MKTAGIIGGIGPESTIEYYRAIIAAFRQGRPDADYPSIIINSISVKKLLELVGANQLAALSDWLTGEVERLAKARADFALFASNTPHIVFDELARRSPIPLISIVEATCKVARVRVWVLCAGGTGRGVHAASDPITARPRVTRPGQ